ncbi:hypothetical protein B0G81_7817 [Paraburkholderia sp. BL6665CI2N2]|uniref:hypothetical protein n=1 Tax=Paraburkholderia sp. BL6665CI2N2 TaxID=1938806 RepID=UPI001064B44C|nr:hypothetical protein [Paraburkholderia sp. BL6665CI2N2]TDY16724.1 hypothetical protein B0G81_7817 [Paraburkholderia sp. BL6665CI2N2]
MSEHYLFFRTKGDSGHAAYLVVSGWIGDPVTVLHPGFRLDDQTPYRANPTAVYDGAENKIYVLLRKKSTNSVMIMRSISNPSVTVDLKITSLETIIPYMASDLHLFHQPVLGYLSWSKINSWDEVMQTKENIVSLDGYPSIVGDSRSARLFYTYHERLASVGISNFGNMQYDATPKFYSNLSISYSPSAIAYDGGDGGKFAVFYQSKRKPNELRCATFDSVGDFKEEYTWPGEKISIATSPSVLPSSDLSKFSVYYINKNGGLLMNASISVSSFLLITSMSIMGSNALKEPDAAPFAVESDMLFSGSPLAGEKPK